MALSPDRLRRFFGVIEKSNGMAGCWLWRGSIQRDGYGVFRSMPAHRVAYEWMVGVIPDGLEIDHLCRNRACVNPHHLEPVTRAENQRRKSAVVNFEPREYCRRGHALVGDNVRWWSNGVSRRHCFACYRMREERKAKRHAS